MISASLQSGSLPRASGRRTRFWPLLVIGLLSGQLLVCSAIIYFANADPSMAVEPQYYEKALAWNHEAAQRERNRRLGWRVKALLESSASAGAFDICLTLHDPRDQPIRGATVGVTAFPHLRSRERRSIALQEQADGTYIATLPAARPGLWELRVRASRGSDEFSETLTVEARAARGATP